MTELKRFLPFDYIYLKPLYQKAESDPHSYAVPAAFEALAVVAGCWRGYGKFQAPRPEPTGFVPVPVWALDTIAAGWIRYRAEDVKGRTLGEALGIEGRGQGRRPRKESWNNWFRDLRLAKELYELRRDNTYEDAVHAVAESNRVSESTVRRAWSAHGQAIEAAAASFTTSESGDSDD